MICVYTLHFTCELINRPIIQLVGTMICSVNCDELSNDLPSLLTKQIQRERQEVRNLCCSFCTWWPIRIKSILFKEYKMCGRRSVVIVRPLLVQAITISSGDSIKSGKYPNECVQPLQFLTTTVAY